MNTSTEHSKSNRPVVWLFNPFMYVAGWQALFAGLTVFLITALIGSVGEVHFDGVLDTHIGTVVPLWFFIAEGLLNWLSMSVCILVAGLILRGFSFRIIDVFGTQALARWPMLLAAAAGILPVNLRVNKELIKLAENPNQFPPIPPMDMVVFTLAMIVIVIMTAWMVALMYKAYSISCNIKGAKAIVSFIVCLIIAEIISKIPIFIMIGFLSGEKA